MQVVISMLKWPQHEGDFSSLSKAKIKNAWNFHSTICLEGVEHFSALPCFNVYLYYSSMLNRDPTGEWEYEMPFDLNMKDVTGQNVLYVASFLGNYKMVELLLKFRVKASRIKASLINDHCVQCPKLHY
jgi:hypothetical protein